MKVELFPFQKKALASLRNNVAAAMGGFHSSRVSQVVSFTAPTGSGKTIIMASLIEYILFGDDYHPDQQDAVFVWLSDSPQLNEQSKLKIDALADRINIGQCVTIEDESFDQETLNDGTIYFLNTQKLSKSGNLTKKGDARTYTIWETLANTAREKSNRFYVIIDEAHRGAQGRDIKKATSIMQKFLKGSEKDGLPPMPVVIGMSATTERFNRLIENTTSTIHKSVVSAEEVRASGLLKERIIITYPEQSSVNKDMAILQAAAVEWKDKWDHWEQYCREQHYAYVNPVLVVQVANGTADALSETDLDDCLKKIEEGTGLRFDEGQVVHTFGQTNAPVLMNGLVVPYVEPSRISDDKEIRVVFFKESLSTGWDCPRAETMMSFRSASDTTYIAQLLGRMVRTPMQMHIQVDETLNDVHLFLPNFDESTVNHVIEALQSSEGGEITDIYGEELGSRKLETLTVKKSTSRRGVRQNAPGQMVLGGGAYVGEDGKTYAMPTPTKTQSDQSGNTEVFQAGNHTNGSQGEDSMPVITWPGNRETNSSPKQAPKKKTEQVLSGAPVTEGYEPEPEPDDDLFDREGVVRFINEEGLLTYDVRTVTINNYLASLFKLSHLLVQSGLFRAAISDVMPDIVAMIRAYVDSLKNRGVYDEYADAVRTFKLETQIFDVFGETMESYREEGLFATTDSDIDRQFRLAEMKLGNEGIGNEYGNRYIDWNNPNEFKIDVVLFAADDRCREQLHAFAKKRFNELNDKYRVYFAKIESEKIRSQYDNIVSDSDLVSKHSFRLPETIQAPHDPRGKEYRRHLFVNEETGVAKIRLNSWESGVIAEEEKRDDFVCWIRNPSRASWALTIPYQIDQVYKPAYPDFLIVRSDEKIDYIVDILEPHDSSRIDNLGKAKGFAEYARQNPGVGRLQLIRQEKDIAGTPRFKRLDLTRGVVREKVRQAISNEELDHIFDTEGFFD